MARNVSVQILNTGMHAYMCLLCMRFVWQVRFLDTARVDGSFDGLIRSNLNEHEKA